jgi:hypothetical protein
VARLARVLFYVYHIMSPVVFFFFLKMASPVLPFLKKYLTEAYLLSQPYWAANLKARAMYSLAQKMK